MAAVTKARTFSTIGGYLVPPGLLEYEKEILRYGVNSFFFILNRGEYSYAEYAELVLQVSVDPRAQDVARIMKKAHVLLTNKGESLC